VVLDGVGLAASGAEVFITGMGDGVPAGADPGAQGVEFLMRQAEAEQMEDFNQDV